MLKVQPNAPDSLVAFILFLVYLEVVLMGPTARRESQPTHKILSLPIEAVPRHAGVVVDYV